LSADNFVSGVGPSAAGANDFILYDTATGELFYDADGSGAGAAVKFAVLASDPDGLSALDFTIT
jgi:Ca2+-binding RTX toxin-like protein